MTSTCSISRLLIRAWAPVSFMVDSYQLVWDSVELRYKPGNTKPLAQARGRKSAPARGGAARYVITTRSVLVAWSGANDIRGIVSRIGRSDASNRVSHGAEWWGWHDDHGLKAAT